MSPRRTPGRLALAAVAAALLSAACAPAPPPVAPTDADAPPRPPTSAGPAWRTYADGVTGMSAAMPAEPTLAHFTLEGTPPRDARILLLADGDPTTPDYELTRIASLEPGVPFSLDDSSRAITASWKRVDRRQKRERDGMETIEVEGIFRDGPAMMRMTSLGGWIYTATIRSPAGLDRDAAARFFDSVHIELPWKIEVFDREALTVALPAPVVELPRTERESLVAHVYTLAGPSDLTFSISWFVLTDERLAGATPNHILDDGVRGLSSNEKIHIQSVAPIEHHDVPGREINHSTSDGITTRTRMFMLGHRVYLVTVAAKDAAAVTQPTATRFLDSLRIGAVP